MDRSKDAGNPSPDQPPEAELRAQVCRQPEPGRPVPVFPLVRWVLSRPKHRILVSLGVLSLLLVAGWIGWGDPTGPGAWAGVVLLAGVGLGMLTSTLMSFRRLNEALRRGLVRKATVHEAHFEPPGGGQSSRREHRHGLAWGMRVVEHPRGHFEDEFECDDPWAPDLEAGTTVRVLVHPTRKKTLLDLGPEGRSPGPGPEEG